MPDQYAKVHKGAALAQHPHIFGEGLEPPVDAGAQRVDVHALDDRQIAHDQIAQVRRRGHDPEAAISIMAVVTPSEGDGDRVGSQVTCASKWVCRSMMPGISVSPPASTISDASLPTSPIAAMRPSRTATSVRIGSCPSPSTTLAPRITRSCMLSPCLQ